MIMMSGYYWQALRAGWTVLRGVVSLEFVLLGGVCATLLPGALWAQTADERIELRHEIDAQRAINQKTYMVSRTACYQVFAVNDCLITAKKKHDTVQSELRRQEVILNDGERKRKSAAQWKKMDDKLESGAEQAAIDQRAQKVEEAAQHQRTLTEKQRQAQEKVAPTPRDSTTKPPRAAPNPAAPKQAVSQPMSPADQAIAAQAYATKQAEAVKHQNEVEDKRRTRTKPLSAPLPVAGAASTPLAAQLLASPPVGVKPEAALTSTAKPTPTSTLLSPTATLK
jgi:colicin import membrane protein